MPLSNNRGTGDVDLVHKLNPRITWVTNSAFKRLAQPCVDCYSSKLEWQTDDGPESPAWDIQKVVQC